MGKNRRVDVATLLAEVDLAKLIEGSVRLKKRGREFVGLCPFHDERSPSFTVYTDRDTGLELFCCHGCGAKGNAIEWVIRTTGCDFLEACRLLGAKEEIESRVMPRKERAPRQRSTVWIPLLPVPDAVPALVTAGEAQTADVWNPKADPPKFVRYRPQRADAYRDADGRLLGYVLRLEFDDRNTGKRVKITPTVTWCVGPEGEQRWCLRPFPLPRPMLGLDAIAAKPASPVLIVEGEKCRAAGAGALPMYAVASWPGGGKGVPYVDFSPLCGRDVVLWPDADEPGRNAMLGHRDYSGLLHDGVAQLAWRAGARSIRYVDVTGQPKGWDLADALDHEGDNWTARQLAAWAKSRVAEIEIDFQPGVRAA